LEKGKEMVAASFLSVLSAACDVGGGMNMGAGTSEKKIVPEQSIGFVEGLIRLAQSCIHSLMKNGDDQRTNKKKHHHLSYINVARMRFLQSCVAATTTMTTTTTVHGSVVVTDEEEGRPSKIILFLSYISMCLQHMTKDETFGTKQRRTHLA